MFLIISYKKIKKISTIVAFMILITFPMSSLLAANLSAANNSNTNNNDNNSIVMSVMGIFKTINSIFVVRVDKKQSNFSKINYQATKLKPGARLDSVKAKKLKPALIALSKAKAVPKANPVTPALTKKRPDVLEGVDYSWGYFKGLAPKLKRSKKHFVMRYAYTGEGKEITASEVKELKKAGLGIGIVHQITKKDFRPLEGFKAGQTDARTARQSVHDVGLSSKMPIYFSVDFEASAAQQVKINQYLKGAASVLGKDKVGVYGGYFTVARALNAGIVKYAWQTYSWSKGKWDPRAQIRQYKNRIKQDGADADLDRTNHSDNGIQY